MTTSLQAARLPALRHPARGAPLGVAGLPPSGLQRRRHPHRSGGVVFAAQPDGDKQKPKRRSSAEHATPAIMLAAFLATEAAVLATGIKALASVAGSAVGTLAAAASASSKAMSAGSDTTTTTVTSSSTSIATTSSSCGASSGDSSMVLAEDSSEEEGPVCTRSEELLAALTAAAMSPEAVMDRSLDPARALLAVAPPGGQPRIKFARTLVLGIEQAAEGDMGPYGSARMLLEMAMERGSLPERPELAAAIQMPSSPLVAAAQTLLPPQDWALPGTETFEPVAVSVPPYSSFYAGVPPPAMPQPQQSREQQQAPPASSAGSNADSSVNSGASAVSSSSISTSNSGGNSMLEQVIEDLTAASQAPDVIVNRQYDAIRALLAAAPASGEVRLNFARSLLRGIEEAYESDAVFWPAAMLLERAIDAQEEDGMQLGALPEAGAAASLPAQSSFNTSFVAPGPAAGLPASPSPWPAAEQPSPAPASSSSRLQGAPSPAATVQPSTSAPSGASSGNRYEQVLALILAASGDADIVINRRYDAIRAVLAAAPAGGEARLKFARSLVRGIEEADEDDAVFGPAGKLLERSLKAQEPETTGGIQPSLLPGASSAAAAPSLPPVASSAPAVPSLPPAASRAAAERSTAPAFSSFAAASSAPPAASNGSAAPSPLPTSSSFAMPTRTPAARNGAAQPSPAPAFSSFAVPSPAPAVGGAGAEPSIPPASSSFAAAPSPAAANSSFAAAPRFAPSASSAAAQSSPSPANSSFATAPAPLPAASSAAVAPSPAPAAGSSSSSTSSSSTITSSSTSGSATVGNGNRFEQLLTAICETAQDADIVSNKRFNAVRALLAAAPAAGEARINFARSLLKGIEKSGDPVFESAGYLLERAVESGRVAREGSAKAAPGLAAPAAKQNDELAAAGTPASAGAAPAAAAAVAAARKAPAAAPVAVGVVSAASVAAASAPPGDAPTAAASNGAAPAAAASNVAATAAAASNGAASAAANGATPAPPRARSPFPSPRTADARFEELLVALTAAAKAPGTTADSGLDELRQMLTNAPAGGEERLEFAKSLVRGIEEAPKAGSSAYSAARMLLERSWFGDGVWLLPAMMGRD